MARSENRQDLFGNEYVVHFDDTGKEVGRSRTEEKLFGGEVTKTYDNDGNLTSRTEEEESLFGKNRAVTRSKSGDVEAITTKEATLFGEDHLVTRDTTGQVVSRTYEREGFFGNKYRETIQERPPDESGSWIGSLIGKLVVAGIAIWLAIMALMVAAMSAPIWLGALAAGVIVGFLLAPGAVARISDEQFAEISVREETNGKKSRARLTDDSVKKAVRFSPHLMVILGTSLAYTAGMAIWPLVSSPDTFTQIVLAVAALVGVILATIAGRRVMCWRFENLVFERAKVAEPPNLIAPNVAIGIAIPGILILIGAWFVGLSESGGDLAVATKLGLEERQSVRTSPAPSAVDISRPPIPSLTPILPEGTPSSLPTAASGTFLAESADGRWQCLVSQNSEGGIDIVARDRTGTTQILADSVLACNEAIFSDTAEWLAIDVGTGSLGSVPRIFTLNRSDSHWTEVPDLSRDAAVAAYREHVGPESPHYPDHLYITFESIRDGDLFMTVSGNWSDADGRHTFSIPEVRVALTGTEATAEHSTDPADSLHKFVLSKLAAERSHDIGGILENYAEEVAFWDNGTVDHDFIRKDKEDYFSRWPVTSEVLVGEIAASQDGSEWTVQFKTRFRVENATRDVTISGIQRSDLVLTYVEGRYRILSEKGTVLERERTDSQQRAEPNREAATLFPGERFPHTRTRRLQRSEVEAKSSDEIQYAINEMFARHGAEFSRDEVRQEFERFPWYAPRPNVDYDQIESEFSDLEKANLLLLGDVRNTMSETGSSRPASSLPPRKPSSSESPNRRTARSGSWPSGVYEHHAKDGSLVATNDWSVRLNIDGTSVIVTLTRVRYKRGEAERYSYSNRYSGPIISQSFDGFSFKVTDARRIAEWPRGWHKGKGPASTIGEVWTYRRSGKNLIREGTPDVYVRR